jgi:membrane fusion protein, heavy metal efflux system
MKQLILSIILILPTFVFSNDNGDHDHGPETKTAASSDLYFTSEAVSDKYELFLKYDPIQVNENAVLRLFISEYLTNTPVDSATIKIQIPGETDVKLNIKHIDHGYYEVSGKFPSEKKYALSVSINSKLGPDLLLLQNIEPGKQLPQEEVHHETHLAESALPFIIGLSAGLLLMFLFMRARYRKVATILLILIISLPTATFSPVIAHEGHDEQNGKGNNFSGAFTVPKETQFLFDVTTQPVERGQFRETTKLFGTVIPSTNGQAIIQSPQTGKIAQLSVKVGERVMKGALLAVISPSLDAGSTVNLLAEKNNVEAELQAAKTEYERLKSIEDIAAKRDVAEAEARYQKARENKMLYERLASGSVSSGAIFLRAPISGTVGNFTNAVGSTVNANDAILTLTNLSTVYVEAQVFDKDADQVNTGKNFLVECANADEHKTAEVKLLAPAQSINPTNQTQRVIFEMENPDGDFKIGEFVNVRVFASQPSREIALPNSAITEINGRPVVFIKDSAEKYSVSYITSGQNNGTHTIIKKGVEDGERVVTRSTYQMKMIYLNQ